jgi:hypothetical protein
VYLSLSSNGLATKGLAFQNGQPFRSFIQLQSALPGLETPMIWDADFLQPDSGTYVGQVRVSGGPSV